MSNTSEHAILALIRSAETSKGYEDFYSGSKIKPPKPVTQMTVNEVMEWQRRSVSAGSKSSAIGGYQMIHKTFKGVASELGLTGDEVFDSELQDRMGMHLLARRGYNDWVSGKITDQQFHQNLSQEWAGLPAATKDARGRKASGQSYYAGDGLNASTVTSGNVLEALNAARNGQAYAPVAGAGGANTGSPSTSVSTPVGEYEASLADFKPLEGQAQEVIDRVQETPVAAFRSIGMDREIASRQEENTPGWWDATKMAIDEEWIGTNVARQLGREEFAPDPNFELTDDLWKELTDGLDPVFQEGIFDATSEAHARALADRMRHEQSVDQQLAGLGWGGTGLRLGAAILDPVAILASAATEGVAAPVIYGAKVGRVGRMLRAGAAAGAVNAGLDGYLASQDVTMGWDDVAMSAAAGFVLGGAVGGLRGKTPEDDALVEALQRDVLEGEADNIARSFTGEVADGSVGAARVEQEVQLSAAEQVALDSAGAPETAMAGVRLDRSAVLKSSESDIMRRVGGGLVEDGVGNKGDVTNRFSVSEKVAREERVRNARFYRTYNEAYKGWLKDQGKRMFWQHGASDRAEFNKQVSMAVRRELDAPNNAHVAKVAGQMKKEFADLLKFGREHGIRGFDEIKENYNYMVRRHRIDRIDAFINERKGNAGVLKRLFAESIQSSNRKWRNANPGRAMAVDEIDYEDALKIADSYITSIRNRRYGEFSLNRALAGQDIETLTMMLEDAGMAADDVTRITDKVRFQADTGEQGRIASAKWRLDLDETYSIPIKGDPKRSSLSIEDFLENDAEQLFGQYLRSVTAEGHMEDFLKEFRVRDAEGNLPAHAPSFETVKGYIAKEAQEKGMSTQQFNKEMRILENSYKLIKGIPIEEASGFRTAQRMLRDYNFSRIGGQLGVAQLAEIGNIVSNGGLRVLLSNIPALRRIFTNAKTGKFSDEFLNEIEAIWGYGTDLTRMNMSPMFDEMGAVENAAGSSKLQKADHALQRAKKFTVVGSGMGHVNMVLQRMNARVIVQRFMDDATGRRDINPRRLAVMGIPKDLHPRVQEQLRKHVDQSTGMLGKKVSRLNIHKWDDVDAKNAFINGVDRWAKKSIQENDIGNMPDFMSKEMGKTIMQFRSFMMAAYVKQTLAGAHLRDWETLSSFLTSMFFGGLFYAGQQYVNSAGRDDREEFLERRLNPQALAEAAFQRAAFSSVLPIAFDTLREGVGLEPVFDFRSSGLRGGGGPVGAALGNPTGDLIDGIFRGTGGIVQGAFSSDYAFSEKDFNAVAKLALFQNMFGIRNGLAAIGGQFPDYSQ